MEKAKAMSVDEIKVVEMHKNKAAWQATSGFHKLGGVNLLVMMIGVWFVYPVFHYLRWLMLKFWNVLMV